MHRFSFTFCFRGIKATYIYVKKKPPAEQSSCSQTDNHLFKTQDFIELFTTLPFFIRLFVSCNKKINKNGNFLLNAVKISLPEPKHMFGKKTKKVTWIALTMHFTTVCECVYDTYTYTNCNLIKNNLYFYYYILGKHKMWFVVYSTNHFNAYFYTFCNVFCFCVLSRFFTTYIWFVFKEKKNIWLQFVGVYFPSSVVEH